nr:unnamed protein product [Meloidogyne enterolobii]
MCDKDMCNSVIEKLNNTKTEAQVDVVATDPPKPVDIVEVPPPKPPATQNFAFGKYVLWQSVFDYFHVDRWTLG